MINVRFNRSSPAGRLAVVGSVGILAWWLAPSSLSLSALQSMSPFVAFLSIAAFGQHLVMQQRGIDISVAGVVSLAAVVTTNIFVKDHGLAGALACVSAAIGLGAVSGLMNGLAVHACRIPPLVATMAANSILFGFVLWISRGVPNTAPALLEVFSIGRVLGMSNVLLFAAAVMLVLLMIEKRTLAGRRMQAVGLNESAAAAIGISVQAYKVGAYAVAGGLYGVAGVLLGGFLHVPTIYVGNDYLLSSVAAVVLGSRLAGMPHGSIATTALGAFFLVYVTQLVNALGLPTSVQYMIQAGILLLGVASGNILANAVRGLSIRRTAPRVQGRCS